MAVMVWRGGVRPVTNGRLDVWRSFEDDEYRGEKGVGGKGRRIFIAGGIGEEKEKVEEDLYYTATTMSSPGVIEMYRTYPCLKWSVMVGRAFWDRYRFLEVSLYR